MQPTETTSEPAARVRGSLVASRLAFIANRWGEQARVAVIGQLLPEEARRTGSVAIDGDWFDYETIVTIDAHITHVLAPDSSATAIEAGWFAAEHNYRRVAKQLAQLEPDRLVERLGRLSAQLQDFVQFEYEEIGRADENRGSAYVFTYTLPVTPFYCAAMLGYYSRMLELLGLRVIGVGESSCGGEGDGPHRYEIWWSPAPLSEEPPVADPRAARVFRDAVTAAEPGSPRTSRELPEWPAAKRSRRPRVLMLLLLLMAGSWVATDGLTWLLGGPELHEKKIVERVRPFVCTGSIEAAVTFDSSGLTIRNITPVRAAVIAIEQSGREFTRPISVMQANGAYGLALSEFRDMTGRPPNPAIRPTAIRIREAEGLSPASCECAQPQ